MVFTGPSEGDVKLSVIITPVVVRVQSYCNAESTSPLARSAIVLCSCWLSLTVRSSSVTCIS